MSKRTDGRRPACRLGRIGPVVVDAWCKHRAESPRTAGPAAGGILYTIIGDVAIVRHAPGGNAAGQSFARETRLPDPGPPGTFTRAWPRGGKRRRPPPGPGRSQYYISYSQTSDWEIWAGLPIPSSRQLLCPIDSRTGKSDQQAPGRTQPPENDMIFRKATSRFGMSARGARTAGALRRSRFQRVIGAGPAVCSWRFLSFRFSAPHPRASI